MSDSTQEVRVNGEVRQVPAPCTVAELLVHLGVGGRRVAVERNRQLVPRAEHDAVAVQPGDEFEIVSFVGGG